MLIDWLIGLGVACAITGLLTVIILVCEATIANYGQVRVTVNGEKELVADGGRPLLGLLKDHGIFIPSACGGRGSCGLCKLKTVSGGGQPLPTELPWLSPREKADGIRLSCQFKVKADLSIQIPEELFKVRQYRTRVDSIRDLTHDIKEVVFRLPEGETIDLRAGQFVQVEVPPYELTDEPVYRAYSVSSSPSLKDRVELEIRLVPNGICTTYVHRYLKVGDEMTLNGPYGDFFLRESGRDIVFIAGGSGMAPIKAILHQMAETGCTRRARYFFGARTVKDLFLVDEMRAFERKLPDFRFVPALSAPETGVPWDGETGLITEVVDRQVASGDNLEAYLCGSPGMIDACIAVLKKKGVPTSLIYFDKFS